MMGHRTGGAAIAPCAATLDHAQTVARHHLRALITTLSAQRMAELRPNSGSAPIRPRLLVPPGADQCELSCPSRPTRSGLAHDLTHDLLQYRIVSPAADGQSFVTVAADSDGSLWLAPRDGKGRPRKVAGSRVDGVHGLGFAPDGRIVYTSVEGGRLGLWQQPTDGRPPKRITDFQDQLIFEFALSPDGKSLAYSRGARIHDALLVRDFR